VDLQVALTLSEVTATVTVSAEAAVLDTARTQIAGTLPQDEIRNVPLNGRNFLDLALAIPGVSLANVGSTQLFPETSAVAGAGLSVASQRNLSNNFVVDGLSANDDAAGLSGMTYSVDAVEQFQVITSGAQAELGRALGGYLNIVTKSGTNRHQGDTYVYLRDDALNARNPLTGSTVPMQQWQYGASAGGPLVRDRTFYFANAERRRLDQTGVVTIAPDVALAINGGLAATGYRGPLVATGLYQNPVRSTNVLSRIDHQIGGSDLFTVRYSAYDVHSENARGAGGLNAPSASAALDNIDHTVALSNTRSLSSRIVNETRAQFAYSDLEAPPTDTVGPAVSIAGVATFGRLSSSPTARLNRMLQIIDNVSRQSGAHAIRAGVDFLYNGNRITFPRSAGGSYTFSSLQNFLAGVYNNAGFTQTFGVSRCVAAELERRRVCTRRVEARARHHLELRAPLRRAVSRDGDHRYGQCVAARWPRLGTGCIRPNGGPGQCGGFLRPRAAESGRERIAVRRQHDGPGEPSPDQRKSHAGSGKRAGVPECASGGRPVGHAHQPHNAGQASPERIVAAGQCRSRAPDRQSADAERRLSVPPRRGAADVGQSERADVYRIGHQQWAAGPIPPTATTASTRQSANRRYHGLQLSLLQRPARWGEYRVSYTLSKSMNNVGEFFFSSPIDPFDLSKDWGRSDDDQRQRLAITATARTSTAAAATFWQHVTNGLQVSGVLQAYSALPLNITSGVTTVQGTAGRPVVNGTFIARNSGIGNDFLTLNLRGSRTVRIDSRFQIEAIAEAFNLTNRVNVVTRNTTFGAGAYPSNPSATFRQITAVAEPRSFSSDCGRGSDDANSYRHRGDGIVVRGNSLRARHSLAAAVAGGNGRALHRARSDGA
jgi:hypothetical protein